MTRDAIEECLEDHQAGFLARNPDALARYSAARRVAHEPRICAHCCGEFTPGRADQEYCSAVCRWRAQRQRAQARRTAERVA